MRISAGHRVGYVPTGGFPTARVTQHARERFHFKTARFACSGGRDGYARHGRDCHGVQVPCTSLRVSRRSVYQMMAPIDKVLDEGGHRRAALVGGRVTDRGEEACECVRKCRPDFAAGHILVKAARLRTETPVHARGALARDPAGTESEMPLTNGQVHCHGSRPDKRPAVSPRTVIAEETLGTACSASQKRLMRTRMSGGVGRVIRKDGPYPISAAPISIGIRRGNRKASP
ncbi:MAG: hypothetical protein KatS3mg111_4391 [Pirellulaceae bacterium]|nr:MAG: hypothetical protein KatS3mg111_4391 [Pirellulaceae bacterium]